MATLKGATSAADADTYSALLAVAGVSGDELTAADRRDLRSAESALRKANAALTRLRARHGWQDADWDEQ